MLTDKQIRSAKPSDRLYRMADGGGLFLAIHPSGRKTFQLMFRAQGKQTTRTLGEYPDLTLADARFEREAIKRRLRRGECPPELVKRSPTSQGHAEVAPERTWAEWMRRYLTKRRREGAAPATMKKLELHAEIAGKVLDDMEPRAIKAGHIIEACRHYEEKGMLNSAHAVRALCSQVFRFCIAHGAADFDPAAPARDAIARPRNSGYTGVTEPKRIGELMLAIQRYPGDPVVRVGLLLYAYLFPRNGEIRRMTWSQIDFDKALWTVPAAQMKKKREHLVPLPRQALDQLTWLRQLTGREELVLHSRTSNTGILSENTFNQALRKIGFGPDEHVHHGFRITASTILNEQGWNSDWIERQLAHVEENKIRGAYNKALYLQDRVRMMQAYADWLDEQVAEAENRR